MGFDFEPYKEFYRMLLEYIPSLGKVDRQPRYVMLNIDLIRKEAEMNGFVIKHGSIATTNDYDFEEHYDDGEVVDLIFNGFSDIGHIIVLESENIGNPPFECKFTELKEKIESLPMPIFDSSDVVIIWKKKRIITLFQHTGYFAHIYCDLN